MIGPQNPAPESGESFREWLLVVGLTVVGAVIRLWAPQRLGLVHFDEGIYALAGLWPFSRGGLSNLDPNLISYAPPGFPFLVGLAYLGLGLGISDLAAIVVSVIAGTLTIPAAALLARRTFGPGAGVAAAALVALSGFHVAYSRMALTDASFLLCWVLGLISGQWFLKRPGLLSALALGSTTGLAQLFKYNGWLIGGFVILGALIGPAFDSEERSRRLLAIWGYGLAAAVVAALVYWPWFRFVETHGGYSRLLEHHRGYVGGLGTWLPHLRLQIDQMVALSGGPIWVGPGFVAALLGSALAAGLSRGVNFARLAIALVIGAVIVAFPAMYWVLGLTAVFGMGSRGVERRLLGVSWLGLSLMTPFYHPYARLWLPVYLLGLLSISDFLGFTFRGANTAREDGRSPGQDRSREVPLLQHSLVVAVLLVALGSPARTTYFGGPGECPGVLASSDSLRLAVQQVLADLPPGTLALRQLVRPPVTFYEVGRISTLAEPGLSSLLGPGAPGSWALVDLALLRQEGDLEVARQKLNSRWELVREYPTELNLPTLLDVDPGAARSGRSAAATAPLLLLRPRNEGPSP